MKRELTELQQHALQLARERYPKVNGAFTVTGSELTVERRMGYVSGYTTCAESSVPLELAKDMEQSLRDCMGAIQWLLQYVEFGERAAKVYGEYNERAFANDVFHNSTNPISSAQEVLNKAKSYLP